MTISSSFKLNLVTGAALCALAVSTPFAASAQTAPDATTPVATPESKGAGEIVITGSRIRQNPNNSPVPLQIITTQEI